MTALRNLTEPDQIEPFIAGLLLGVFIGALITGFSAGVW